MTELHIENKQSICEIIWNFFKKMFTTNKKIVIRSRCKDSCCCKNCSCIAALDEKENDDNSNDIIIIDENIKVS